MNKSSEFFDRLRSAGLIRKGEANREAIVRLTRTEIIDTAHHLAEMTSAAENVRENSLFAHSASLSLGGGRQYCSSAICRTERAFALAQFGVLYSDRVYVHNFLADHVPHPGHGLPSDDEKLRDRFYDDLVILNHLEPAFNRGSLVLFTPPLGLCPQCLASEALGEDAALQLRSEVDLLAKRLAKITKVTLSFDDGQYHVSYRTPEGIFEHPGGGYNFGEPPSALKSMPHIVRRVRQGEQVRLSSKDIIKLGVHQDLADPVLYSIAFDLACSQALGTTFVTDRPVEVEILSALTRDEKVDRRNMIAERYLSTIVPFVTDVSVSDLVRLRDDEAESFIMFRSALTQAIDTYASERANFTEKDARAIYSDVIQPKLARLDGSVREARRKLVHAPVRTAVAWGGAISFGIFAGLLPPQLVVLPQLWVW
jgi:hypothetical protein